MAPSELMCLVQQIVERVTVAVEGIELRLDRGQVAVALTAEGNNQQADTDPILLSIEARLRCCSSQEYFSSVVSSMLACVHVAHRSAS
jgi:hypothetical protein